MSLFRTKSVEQSIAETDEPEHRLKKDLGALDLTIFGVGVHHRRRHLRPHRHGGGDRTPGPALALSFAIAGVGMCAGRALLRRVRLDAPGRRQRLHLSAYATFGELIAWIIGWDLVLEFTIGSAALANSFSGYLQTVLDGTAFQIPASLASAEDGLFNLPAVLVALAVMAILILGIKLSSAFNQIVVAIKLGVVLLVIVAGIGYINRDNYSPFIPTSEGAAEGPAASWTCPWSPRSSVSIPASTASPV